MIRRNFWFGKKKVEKRIQIFGFSRHPSLNLLTALNDLKDRGLRSYGAIKTKLGVDFRKHIETTCLFDALVKPILLYASDFWGCLKLPKLNSIENLHIKFCKELLGFQIQTTNLGVLLELGRNPICIYGKKNTAKYWERILSSYLDSQQGGWANSVKKNSFSAIGLMDILLNKKTKKAANFEVFCREKDIFHQTALKFVIAEN